MFVELGKKTGSSIQGLPGYTQEEVKGIIRDYCNERIMDGDLDIDEIFEVFPHGSRIRGTAKETSDLDAVIFYAGAGREDGLFNILNDDDGLQIEDIKVDINPIQVSNDSQTAKSQIESYKKKSMEYDKEIILTLKSQQKEDANNQKNLRKEDRNMNQENSSQGYNIPEGASDNIQVGMDLQFLPEEDSRLVDRAIASGCFFVKVRDFVIGPLSGPSAPSRRDLIWSWSPQGYFHGNFTQAQLDYAAHKGAVIAEMDKSEYESIVSSERARFEDYYKKRQSAGNKHDMFDDRAEYIKVVKDIIASASQTNSVKDADLGKDVFRRSECVKAMNKCLFPEEIRGLVGKSFYELDGSHIVKVYRLKIDEARYPREFFETSVGNWNAWALICNIHEGRVISLRQQWEKVQASTSATFDRDIDLQDSETLESGHIYQLGLPSAVLKSAGFPNVPIELSAAHLSEKGTGVHHSFNIAEMRGLVNSLQNPIAVFAYGNKEKAQNVIVGKEHNGKNFVVGIHFHQERGNLEVSSVRGLYPKDCGEWLHWIEQGKGLYIDKEKIQTLISQQQRNLADVNYLDLNSTAKIIKDFENPKRLEEDFEENIQIWEKYLRGRSSGAPVRKANIGDARLAEQPDTLAEKNFKKESIPTNLNEKETMGIKKNAEQQAQQAKDAAQAQTQAVKQKATQEQAKAEQAIRDAKQKAANASNKEQKMEEQKARRLTTAAIVGTALGAALADSSRGVFLNRNAKEAPAINGGKIPLTAFNTAVLAAVADQNGYRTSQFVTFDETQARGTSVRKGQKGVSLEWDSMKYTNPSLPKDDQTRTLSRHDYNALPVDAQKNYIPRQTTAHLSVFNIDQTMMQHADAERYDQVVESAGARGETRESILAAIVTQEDKKSDKEGQVSLYKEPDGNYYAYGHSAGILQEKLSSDTSITISPEEVKVSIGSAGTKQQASVPRVGISVAMMPGVVEQLIKSGAHVVLDDRYSVPQEPKVDAHAALKNAISQAKAVMKSLGGKVEMTKGSDEAGLSPTDRNTLLVGRLSKGSTVTAGLAKTAAVYRGVVEALTDHGRVNTYRNTLLHNDKPVFKALIQEMSVASLMVRAGLPAAISGHNRAFVPQWQEMLSSNPALVDSLKNSVNRVVSSYDRLASGESVNFAIVNGDNKKYYNKYSIANGIAALAAGTEAVAVADKKHNILDVVTDSRMTARQQEVIRSQHIHALESLFAGFTAKDVRFFTSRGGGALVQPNEYFAGSQAALLAVGESGVKVKKEIDLTSMASITEHADLREMHAYKSGDRWAFLIRPRDGEAFSVYPSGKDRSIYFNARQGLKDGTVTNAQFTAIIEGLNQSNYRAAMAKPELQQHILIPKVEDAITSQVERAFQKRDKDGANLLVARIAGEWMSAPLDNAQSSRKFLFTDNVADDEGTTHLRLDKDAVQKYNTSLALDVFMDKLTLTDEQRGELSTAFHPSAPEPVREEETKRTPSHLHM